jgi:hypothetical protein
MTEVFLERTFETPMTTQGVFAMAARAGHCFGMHRVEWIGSFLSTDGRKMICRFRAPDMESARIAMRQSDFDMRVVWNGSVHDRPGLTPEELAAANVVVERRFSEPADLQEVQDLEDAGIWCLDIRNVRFVRTFFSADRKRMICLYRAPDAESVRQAQRQAQMPLNDVWAFQTVNPEDM